METDRFLSACQRALCSICIWASFNYSPGQKIDRNISTQHTATLLGVTRSFWRKMSGARVWPSCCDVLWHVAHVGCYWLKFENGPVFHATFVDVAWFCSRLVSPFGQIGATMWRLGMRISSIFNTQLGSVSVAFSCLVYPPREEFGLLSPNSGW